MPKGTEVINTNGEYPNDNPLCWGDLDLLAATLNAVLWSGSNSQRQAKQSLSNIATVAVAEHDKTLVFAFNDHTFNPSFMPKGRNVRKNLPSESICLQDVAVRADRVGFHEYKKTVSAPPFGRNEIFDFDSERFVIKQVHKTIPARVKGVSRYIVRDYSFRLKKKGAEFFNPKNIFEMMLKQVLEEDNIVTTGMKVDALSPTKIAKEHAEMRILKYFKDQYDQAPKYIGVSKPCCHKCAEALDGDMVKYARWAKVPSADVNWTPKVSINNTELVHRFAF